MAGIPQRFQPFMQQAQAEAQVRYGPQIAGLAQLLQQAQATRDNAVQQAVSANAIIQAATRQAQQTLADPSNPITSLAQRDAQLPGTEGSIVAQNLGLTAEATRGLIAQRGVSAAAAQAYQRQQAVGQYHSDLSKIQGQQQALQGQYGSYLTGRYDTQVAADRKQRHDANIAAQRIAAQEITSGVNPNGTVIKGGPKDPAVVRAGHSPTGGAQAGKPKFTSSQVVTARRDFNAGLDLASQRNLGQLLAGPKPQRVQDLTRILLDGLKDNTSKTTVVPSGTVSDPFLAQAAAERYVYGYVSPATNRRLRNEYGIAAKGPPVQQPHPFSTNDPNRLNR